MGTNRLLSPSDTSPRPALLAVKVHEDPQRVRICCTGEIDMSTAEQLVTAVADVLARPGSAVIEMDLAEVGFVDSSGVQALIRCRARSAEHERQLLVTAVQPVVSRFLRITALDDLLSLSSELERISGLSNAAATEQSDGRLSEAEICRHEAATTREAARQARERARQMMRDNDDRRSRLRARWGPPWTLRRHWISRHVRGNSCGECQASAGGTARRLTPQRAGRTAGPGTAGGAAARRGQHDHSFGGLQPGEPCAAATAPGCPSVGFTAVEGTLAGRAFALTETQENGSTSRAAVCGFRRLDGTVRLGVLEVLTGSSPSAQLRQDFESVAAMISDLLMKGWAYGDGFERTRRREPMQLAAEILWNLLQPLTFIGREVAVSAILEPCYDVGGDAFDYAVNGTVLHAAIFDAAGHGIAASDATSLAINAYRNARRGGLDLIDTYGFIDKWISARYPDNSYLRASCWSWTQRPGWPPRSPQATRANSCSRRQSH